MRKFLARSTRRTPVTVVDSTHCVNTEWKHCVQPSMYTKFMLLYMSMHTHHPWSRVSGDGPTTRSSWRPSSQHSRCSSPGHDCTRVQGSTPPCCSSDQVHCPLQHGIEYRQHHHWSSVLLKTGDVNLWGGEYSGHICALQIVLTSIESRAGQYVVRYRTFFRATSCTRGQNCSV